jgi:hypothetical protein
MTTGPKGTVPPSSSAWIPMPRTSFAPPSKSSTIQVRFFAYFPLLCGIVFLLCFFSYARSSFLSFFILFSNNTCLTGLACSPFSPFLKYSSLFCLFAFLVYLIYMSAFLHITIYGILFAYFSLNSSCIPEYEYLLPSTHICLACFPISSTGTFSNTLVICLLALFPFFVFL